MPLTPVLSPPRSPHGSLSDFDVQQGRDQQAEAAKESVRPSVTDCDKNGVHDGHCASTHRTTDDIVLSAMECSTEFTHYWERQTYTCGDRGPLVGNQVYQQSLDRVQHGDNCHANCKIDGKTSICATQVPETNSTEYLQDQRDGDGGPRFEGPTVTNHRYGIDKNYEW